MKQHTTRRTEAPAPITERRAVLRVLRHWRSIRGRRAFPARQDIDPRVIAFDWANCFIVDLANDGDVPIFSYIGEALQTAAWDEGLGARIADCPSGTILAAAIDYIDKAIESRLPVSNSGSGLHDGNVVLFRSILLPLSDDGVRIDAVLGTANFRRIEQNRLIVGTDDRAAGAQTIQRSS